MLFHYLNFFISIFGIAVTIAAMLGPGLIVQHFHYQSSFIEIMLATNFIYLSSVAMEAFFDGQSGFAVYIIMNIANFLQYAMLYTLSALVTYYLGYRIKENGLPYFNVRPFLHIYVLPFVLLLVNHYTKMYYYIGSDNVYHRGPLFLLSQILGVLCQIVALWIYITYRRYLTGMDQILFLPYTILPSIGAGLQVVSHGLNIMIIMTTTCTLLLSIVGFVFWNIRYSRKKQELEQLRVTMRVGDIHPDYIYSTLDDISQLCRLDPEIASDVIDVFADYLRKSMNDMSEIGLHPFMEELKHLENYMILACLRFGEKLEVCYDINATKFMIPSQVLQKTAEVMISYVMQSSEDVFCLTIHTDQLDDGYIVEFYDDSFGDDFVVRKQSQQEAQDIEDIRSRLKLMPSSKLTYERNRDIGTIIKIFLSNTEGKYENISSR